MYTRDDTVIKNGISAVIFGCASTQLSSAERDFFAKVSPFGFILFDRNIESPDQTRDLVSSLRDTVGWNAPVLIDQEGGRVQRLRAPHWHEHPSALDLAQHARNPARAFWLRGRLIAAELHALGIDTNCAPLADIVTDQTHEILYNRCYGSTLNDVATCARALSDGQHAGGVLSVLKHIPGHGRANMDSHLELPVLNTSHEILSQTDFAAFRALRDLPMAMTAHIVYSDIDTKTATQSPVIIDLIRQEIGFDGVLMSDDISMNALGGGLAERSRTSLTAGCDLVLHCNAEMNEMIEIADASGALTSQGLARAQRALEMRKTPEPLDMQSAMEELRALSSGLM